MRTIFSAPNAVIVDGSGAEPFVGSVLVRGDRIAEVGENVSLPDRARVIDARGKTLLPGLFDLHTHSTYSSVRGVAGDWPKNLKAYLYSGVTSIVDFGVYPEQFEPMRRLLREGVVAGPRVHMAPRIAPPGGHGLEGGRGDFHTRSVFTPEDGRIAVQELLAYKPDAIKIFNDGWRYGYSEPMADMPRAVISAIVEEAHANDLEVLTHTVTVEGARSAAAAGVDVIAHGVSNAPVDWDLATMMRQRGLTYVPTLAVYHPRGRDVLDDLLTAVTSPLQRARVKPPLSQPGGDSRLVDGYEDPTSPRAVRWGNLMLNNRRLRDAGVTFGAGTDAGVNNAWHGWSTLREIELLVHGGLTPLQAISAATLNGARALNVDQDRGSIEVGKLADLVLVDGAPHTRIADIDRIERVFLGGREIDRSQLARDIATDHPTRLPTRTVPALLDDFEGPGRSSRLGTHWENATDGGLDHAEVSWKRTLRATGNRALTVLATMSNEQDSFASVNLPLSPGAVEPVDLSEYSGFRFEARGEGGYDISVLDYAGKYRTASFEAAPEWKTCEIPFERLEWNGADALKLLFRIKRAAGESAWLELDNVAAW